MKRRVWTRLGLVLLLVAGLVAAGIALAYRSWRSAATPSLLFLAEHKPCYQSTRDKSSGPETVTVYCFRGCDDDVRQFARKELTALGHTEVSVRLPPEFENNRFVTRPLLALGFFHRQDGWVSTQIQIHRSRFAGAGDDGSLSFGPEDDWVSVVITETRRPFSLRELLRHWRRKLPGRNRRQPPPQPPPRPPAPPSSWDAFMISPRKGWMAPHYRAFHSRRVAFMTVGSQMPQNPKTGDCTYYRMITSVTPLA